MQPCSALCLNCQGQKMQLLWNEKALSSVWWARHLCSWEERIAVLLMLHNVWGWQRAGVSKKSAGI